MSSTLGASASRAAAVTVVAQVVKILLMLTTIVVLARLLTPEDYGLVAMVTAFVGIANLLKDFGLSSAAIQAPTVTRAQRDALFWINAGLGVVLAIGIVLVSGPIGAFYGDDRLDDITRALAVTFLLSALSTQYQADLSRRLQLGRVAVVEIVSQSIALAGAVAAALLGLGYWSLVVQQVGQSALTLIGLVVAAGWLPRWYRRGTPVREFIGYAGNLLGAQVLGYISRNVDSIIIGNRFGAEMLGLYNRAFRLIVLPMYQINAPALRVALPVLSRLQADGGQFARYLLAGQNALLYVVIPIYVFAAALAEPLLRFVLGEQWVPAAGLFHILALGGLFEAASNTTMWVFLARGLTRQQLHYALVSRPIVIGLIVLGSMWGVVGVAWGYSVGVTAAWAIGLVWISRVSDAPAAKMLQATLRCVLAWLVPGVAAFATSSALASGGAPLRIVAGLLVFAGAFAAIAVVIPPVRRDVVGFVTTVRAVVGGRVRGRRRGAVSGDGAGDDR